MCLCTRPAATVAPFAQLCHDCSLIILHTVSSWLDMCSALDGSSMRSSITHTHTDRIWMLSRLCVGVKRRKVSWNKRPALVRGKETLRTTCDLFERHFRLSTFSLSFFHCGMGRNKRGCWRSVGSVAVRQLAAVDITRDLKQIEENNKKRKWKIKLLQKPLRCHFIYYLLLAWVRRERGKCPFVVSTEIYFPALLMGSCCCRAHAPAPRLCIPNRVVSIRLPVASSVTHSQYVPGLVANFTPNVVHQHLRKRPLRIPKEKKTANEFI